MIFSSIVFFGDVKYTIDFVKHFIYLLYFTCIRMLQCSNIVLLMLVIRYLYDKMCMLLLLGLHV
jgi:hypothetical protein